MMVSICLITYNHEPYIAQAIESILMQKTDFDVKIIIGEDCSNDRTLEICKAFKEKNPDKIELLVSEKNIGMMPNFIRTLNSCCGKYIALCEGDDYWIDPYKLQKQVDFLELNKDFAICHHNLQIIYENETEKNRLSNINQKEITDIYDLAKGNYIYTASCVFRNQNFILPDWFYNCPIGDYPLHLLNSKYGKIKFINDVMGVYRVHSGGLWECKSSYEISVKILDYLEILIYADFTDDIREIFKIRYNELILNLIKQDKDKLQIRTHILNFVKENPEIFVDVFINTSKELLMTKRQNNNIKIFFSYSIVKYLFKPLPIIKKWINNKNLR